MWLDLFSTECLSAVRARLGATALWKDVDSHFAEWFTAPDELLLYLKSIAIKRQTLLSEVSERRPLNLGGIMRTPRPPAFAITVFLLRLPSDGYG